MPATTVPETTLRALWRHELRWARTIRALEPVGFAASVLQYPLFWAALTVLLAGGAPWSLGWFCARLGAPRRGGSRHRPGALALANRPPVWLLPLRDLMSVAVMVASYAGRQVDWRGHARMHSGEGSTSTMMKTLFLQPPSFDGFDGGAGSRYQARREIRSFWFPTWLAQPAALVPGSKLIDAPPAGIGLRRR